MGDEVRLPSEGEPSDAVAVPISLVPIDTGQDPAELLRRSARGDEDAFARLYDVLGARVFGLVRSVVRDPAQSEEVTQEVFLHLWRTAARFDPALGSVEGWAMSIAHRRAVDRVRSSESAVRRDARYHQQSQVPEHDHTSEAVHSAIEAARVRRALRALTEAQRQAIELAYFGGYTHREVATLLDLPVGTAKTRIRDGLIRLRDHLGAGGAQG